MESLFFKTYHFSQMNAYLNMKFVWKKAKGIWERIKNCNTC